jgi:hypothetical protein
MASCVFAVDEQWAGKPHRNLCDTEEVFNIAGESTRVDRIPSNVIKRSTGLHSCEF